MRKFSSIWNRPCSHLHSNEQEEEHITAPQLAALLRTHSSRQAEQAADATVVTPSAAAAAASLASPSIANSIAKVSLFCR